MNRPIEDNVAAVRARIADACRRASRPTDEVTLVAVSKFVPSPIVSLAMAAGVRDFGESRPQELERKSTEIADQRRGGAIRWHMIGSIQRNKARLVVEHADLIHSVDSLRLARALSDRVPDGQTRDCLVQINISGESTKSGFDSSKAEAAVRAVSAYSRLRVCGLMGMAAYAAEPEDTRPAFAGLRELAKRIEAVGLPGVQMDHLSMGMSNDYTVAIEEGATIVRVGTAIFGERESA